VTDKNASFHRLAQKRLDALLEQIRIFSNLSGPSYDWTAEEIWAYFAQITKALEEALARFQEQKRFHKNTLDEETPARRSLRSLRPVDQGEDQGETQEDTKIAKRKLVIIDMIRLSEKDPEALPEMLILQKEVISHLQGLLNANKIKT
jgi:hypothetical protein